MLTVKEIETIIIALECQVETLLSEPEEDWDSLQVDKNFADRLVAIIAKLKQSI